MKSEYDLHLHLLGAIHRESLESLIIKYAGTRPEPYLRKPQRAFLESNSYGRDLIEFISTTPSPDEIISKLLNFTDLHSFFTSYLVTSTFIRDLDDLRSLLRGVVRRLTDSGTSYSEIIVSPSLYTHKDITLEALLNELKNTTAASDEISINWLLDPVRNRGGEYAKELLTKILDIDDSVFIGVNLAGDEYSHPIGDFSEYFTLAKKHSLGTSLHVGETTPAQQIREALSLPIERIGHGLSILDDDETVNEVIKRDITLEISPQGNIRTGLFKELSEHPLNKMIEAELSVTINSDDPFFFNTSVRDELQILRENGFSEDIIQMLRKNAKNGAFNQ